MTTDTPRTAEQIEDLIAELRIGVIPTDTANAAAEIIEQLGADLAAKTAELEQARRECEELAYSKAILQRQMDITLAEFKRAEAAEKELAESAREYERQNTLLRDAEAKLADAKAVLKNPDMWMRWCDNKVLERCESAEAKLHDVEQQYTAACLKLMDADLKLAESAREYERQNSKLREVEAKYSDLIMQVAKKFPGESRHDTAKRYIMDRENFGIGDDALAKQWKP